MEINILTPKAGETVRGIVRVVAETDLPVTFAVDGQPRATDRVASSAFWWHTDRFPDGAHQLGATVRSGDEAAATRHDRRHDRQWIHARAPAPGAVRAPAPDHLGRGRRLRERPFCVQPAPARRLGPGRPASAGSPRGSRTA